MGASEILWIVVLLALLTMYVYIVVLVVSKAYFQAKLLYHRTVLKELEREEGGTS